MFYFKQVDIQQHHLWYLPLPFHLALSNSSNLLVGGLTGSVISLYLTSQQPNPLI